MDGPAALTPAKVLLLDNLPDGGGVDVCHAIRSAPMRRPRRIGNRTAARLLAALLRSRPLPPSLARHPHRPLAAEAGSCTRPAASPALNGSYVDPNREVWWSAADGADIADQLCRAGITDVILQQSAALPGYLATTRRLDETLARDIVARYADRPDFASVFAGWYLPDEIDAESFLVPHVHPGTTPMLTSRELSAGSASCRRTGSSFPQAEVAHRRRRLPPAARRVACRLFPVIGGRCHSCPHGLCELWRRVRRRLPGSPASR